MSLASPIITNQYKSNTRENVYASFLTRLFIYSIVTIILWIFKKVPYFYFYSRHKHIYMLHERPTSVLRVNCSPENGRCHESLIRKVVGGRSPIYDYSRDKAVRQWYYNVPQWFIAYDTSPSQLPPQICYHSKSHTASSVAYSNFEMKWNNFLSITLRLIQDFFNFPLAFNLLNVYVRGNPSAFRFPTSLVSPNRRLWPPASDDVLYVFPKLQYQDNTDRIIRVSKFHFPRDIT